MFGLSLHPAVVHYPIALGVVGAVAVLGYAIVPKPGLRWVGPVLLAIALAGAGGAYFTGESAKDRAADAGVPQGEIERHESISVWSLGVLSLATLLAWATAASRRGSWVAAPVAVAAAGMILWTSHLGGRLVYIYGAGRVAKSAVPAIPEPGQEKDVAEPGSGAP